jgi:hypothetical protein
MSVTEAEEKALAVYHKTFLKARAEYEESCLPFKAIFNSKVNQAQVEYINTVKSSIKEYY